MSTPSVPPQNSKVPPAPKEEPKQPSKEDLKVLLLAVEKEAMQFVGKEGHNPFVWIRDNVRSLERELTMAELTPELVTKIKALKYPTEGSIGQPMIN